MASVLVVDDNVTFREMIVEVLGEDGHTVTTEARVSAALITLHRHIPDLIMLDMWMEHPDSGLRFVRTLRNDPVTHDIPVIICSAHVDAIKAFETELQRLKCTFVSKPFDTDRLLATVRHALEGENVPAKSR